MDRYALLNHLARNGHVTMHEAAAALHVPLDTIENWVDELLAQRAITIKYVHNGPLLSIRPMDLDVAIAHIKHALRINDIPDAIKTYRSARVHQHNASRAQLQALRSLHDDITHATKQ